MGMVRASSLTAFCAALACALLPAAAQDVPLAPTAADVPAAPLAEAAQRGDTPAVLELLAAGADVNARGSDGTPALHWAVRVSDRATAERLVEAGADVNAASR
jgi:ankyrin repeat protein